MRPIIPPFGSDKYIATSNNNNLFRKGISYDKIDNYGITGASATSNWLNSETGGEYKYKIYFYEGVESTYTLKGKWSQGENKDSINLLGNYYTRGEWCKKVDDILQYTLSYNFGITIKFVGYEIITDSPNLAGTPNYADVYKKYETGKTNTTGISYDDTTKIISSYSIHHFSICVTWVVDQGVAYVAPNNTNLASMNTIHYGLYLETYNKNGAIQHEFLHVLFLNHNTDRSDMRYVTGLNENAPYCTGFLLFPKYDSYGDLLLNEDALHGLDVLYNIQNNRHVKINGYVNNTDLISAESRGQGYLGRGHAFLVNKKDNEMYYDTPIDTTGYFEFKIRVPVKYINALNNLQLYVFVVSSYFTLRYYYTKSTKYGGDGEPISWGKSNVFSLGGISVPYVYSIGTSGTDSNAIRMNNKVYESEGDLRGTIWHSNIYDKLKAASGVVVTYKPYVPKAKSYTVKNENEFICGVK